MSTTSERARPVGTATSWLPSRAADAALHATLWLFQSARWHSGLQYHVYTARQPEHVMRSVELIVYFCGVAHDSLAHALGAEDDIQSCMRGGVPVHRALHGTAWHALTDGMTHGPPA
jgi:hypothetical protein